MPPTVGALAPSAIGGGTPSGASRYNRVQLTAAHRALVNPGPTVKLGFTFFGPPGSGKTVLECMLPGRKLIVSFEEKAEPIRINRFREDPDIMVLNPFPLYADGQLASFKEAQDVLEQLIPEKAAEFQPHWVVFDDAEGIRQIANGYMRYVLDLPKVGGIDSQYWAERNGAMERIMLLGKRCGLMGGACSVYPEEKDDSSNKWGAKKATRLEDGASVVSGNTAKWFGKMVQHFPIAIASSQTYSEMTKSYHFHGHVTTCKESGVLKTGQTFEITQTGDFWDPAVDPPFPWGPRMAELYERANKLCERPAKPWSYYARGVAGPTPARAVAPATPSPASRPAIATPPGTSGADGL
jgi:hypothetical protein